MTAEQLVFDLPVSTGFGRDDFFVSPANELVVKTLENWTDWPLGKLLITGPEGAGKSHLATIWAETTQATVLQAVQITSQWNDSIADGAVCVEDVHLLAGDQLAEQTLFHLHNLMLQNGAPLLMTGRGTVASWGISLPDLLSRLQGTSVVRPKAPDDALLSALLVKQFADRQIRVEPGLISYLLPRIERSFSFAGRLATELDRKALQSKSRISVKMAAQILDSMSEDQN